MIYVFNKKKMISYMVASFIVVSLFIFSSSMIPNKDVELLKVSSNIATNNSIIDNHN